MNADLPTPSPTQNLERWLYVVLGFAVVFLLVFAIAFQPWRIHGDRTSGVRTARSDLVTLEQRIEAFRRIHGRPPSMQEGLSVLPEPPPNAGSSQHWAKGQTPKDPWGYEYQHVYPGKHKSHDYDLYSFGPDGRTGGDDDIGNWGFSE